MTCTDAVVLLKCFMFADMIISEHSTAVTTIKWKSQGVLFNYTVFSDITLDED